MEVNGVCSGYLRRVEGEGEWKNALMGSMDLDDYMYYGSFFYPKVEEVVRHSVNTQKQEVEIVVSHNTHVERKGKRKVSTRFHRIDLKSRHRHVRNTKHYISEEEEVIYFTSKDEKILYRLGLVPLYMSNDDEDFIESCIESDDEYNAIKNRKIEELLFLPEDDCWY